MTTLHQNLCNTIEGRDAKVLTISVFGVVSSKIRGIAVSNAKYTAIARETDIKIKTGIGHYPALGVLKLYGNNSHIAAIGGNQLAVGLKDNLGRDLFPRLWLTGDRRQGIMVAEGRYGNV